MEAKVYNNKGEEKGKLKLSDKVFGLSWNSDLVRQVFLSERANSRKVIAHTKDRSEVSGGGKKPWQQKGTGRARHGSSRSPIWVGGGITHGPRKDRDYSEKINKKARRKAILTILSQKQKDGEILFLEDLKVADSKTKNANAIIKKLPIGDATALVILPKKDEGTWRAFRNLKNISLAEARNITTTDLLSNKFLIISEDTSRALEENFSNK